MVHIYDSQYIPGAQYVVECVTDNTGRYVTHLPIHSGVLSYQEAVAFQKMREQQGINAVIRRW